jgi:hypothetical protein
MGFQQMLLAWKSTLVRDSQPIWGIAAKDLHPLEYGSAGTFVAWRPKADLTI